MNTTQQHNPETSRYSAQNSHKPVNFYCAAPHAKSVELVGDFNHWHPFPMEKSVDGWWLAHVELTHGHHQYRFLVDGQPMLDPHATGVVRDDQGEQASLIAVSWATVSRLNDLGNESDEDPMPAAKHIGNMKAIRVPRDKVM